MNLATAVLYAGGPGSGCHGSNCGRPSSKSESEKKSQRAIASYIPCGKVKRAKATENEHVVASKVSGQHVGDNMPFDVIAGKYGLEVKSIFDGAKSTKITMHPESRVRKEKAIGKLKLKGAYTIAIDTRNGKFDVYIKKGVGAFQLNAMKKIKLSDLKKFIGNQ